MSISNYRSSRPQTSFGNRSGQGGSKKVYLNSWKPTEEPQWVKFMRGCYYNCDVCMGNVQPDVSACDAEGFVPYTCNNIKYENNAPKKDGNSFARCGHKGRVPFEATFPYCETYAAFLPGVGQNGMVVNSNSLNGKRPGIPDLLYHYASIDDQIKIRASYAHTIIVAGTYHAVTQNSARGNAYTVDTLCVGQGCVHCQNNVPTFEGSARSYSPGYGHWNNLAQFNERIGETCLTCRSGTVVPEVYMCGNPNCQEIINDLGDKTVVEAVAAYLELCRALSDKDNRENYGKILCPFCNTWMIPREEASCRKLEWNRRGDAILREEDGCGNPVRMSIFDCEVQLRKASSEKTADLVMETFDPTAFITEEQAARIQPNDFMDATDITPERQSEKMKRPNVFYSETSRSNNNTTAARNPGATAPGAGVRTGGSVNYTSRR